MRIKSSIGGNFQSTIREVKCTKCGALIRQRMNSKGSFEKLKACPKCKESASFPILRVYMG